MLKVALSTSSSGSSGEDENADEQPRCPAPRWRLDPGDAAALEAFHAGTAGGTSAVAIVQLFASET